MMRGAYGRWSGLTEEEIKNPLETEKSSALIPFSFIKGIAERTDIRGQVLMVPETEEVKSALQELVERALALS